MEKMTVSQAKRAISDKLSHFFGVDTKTATDEQYYKAVAMIIRDRLSQMNSDFRHEAKGHLLQISYPFRLNKANR